MNREADVSQQSLQIPTYKAFIYIYTYTVDYSMEAHPALQGASMFPRKK